MSRGNELQTGFLFSMAPPEEAPEFKPLVHLLALFFPMTLDIRFI